ncbi:flagellar basal body P-ring formation chaperone FlgA [Sulfurirhabdus autotrophica]|uniref:Flagella basal body P-ring formation protein FlgA n=1 Tax=Sulfurirhabdus autotrophica TaxID=1706046 RepID=A0A4R3YIA6_9PROT|nr:flagellar basal body P-ring formation chaperone FlgA [Sulfurirhabdus autotrophica]TCV90734.1 flagella basal body P-ring formation protein FlgA [Sulfurirhabdus autotrophica]
MLRIRLLLLFCFLVPHSALAAWQDINEMRNTIDQYIKSQTTELPGKVETSIGTIDPRLQLPQCLKLEAFNISGGRLWGNSTVGIRCEQPSSWSIYVPVNVKVTGEVVVSARPLSRGATIGPDDLTRQNADLTQLPSSVITQPEQAIGKTVTSSVPAGNILRIEMLRAPIAVKQGQIVKIITKGSGFTVSSEGKALSSASADQIISVRTSSGQIISGTVTPEGTVEVQF